jgi:hypothetical protein
MKHTFVIMLTLLTCLPSLVPLQARTDKPNLIVIMADDK